MIVVKRLDFQSRSQNKFKIKFENFETNSRVSWKY